MAFYDDFVENILPIRTQLEDNTLINDPENYQKLTGALSYLFSEFNPRTIDTIMQETSNADKYRPVQVRYQPHWGDEDTATDDANLNCDPVNQRRDFISTFEPNLFASSKATIDESYVRTNQEDGTSPDTRLQKAIMKAMRVGREKMNEVIVAKMATLIGSNPGASERTGTSVGAGDYSALEMIKTDGANSVENFDNIKNDQEDNFMMGVPGIIGLGTARRYFNRLAVGNLNTDAGVDWREIADEFQMLLYKDQFTTSQLGSKDRVLVCYPGLQQFFNYNLYRGFYAKNTPDLTIKGTLPDSVYPFDWDYSLRYDDGCSGGNGINGSWTLTLFSYFDIFTPPEAAFGDVYGELNDFTGIVGYELTEA